MVDNIRVGRCSVMAYAARAHGEQCLLMLPSISFCVAFALLVTV